MAAGVAGESGLGGMALSRKRTGFPSPNTPDTVRANDKICSKE